MVSRVVPRADLQSETFAIDTRIAHMLRFVLALAKKAVIQCEDQMGPHTGTQSVFRLRHFAHAHNAEIGAGTGGIGAAMISAPVPRTEKGP